MPKTIIRFLLAAVLSVTLTAGAVYAHHAFAAEFDAQLPIAVQGEVPRVECINPHARNYVMDEGTAQEWMLEAGTPNTLLRRGVTRTILTVGTEVQVRGYQSKDKICEPVCRGSGRDITFPDGTSLFMGSSGTGAPRDGADPTEPGR